MKLSLLTSRLGKLSVKVIGVACALMALVLLFVVAWGGSYPSYDPNPPILIPRQGDVWHVGELHTVEWSVDGIPTTNSSGKPVLAILMLAYWSQTTEPALLRDEPLTDWIPITDKLANVIVPAVPTLSDYAIFLNAHDDRSSCSGTITIFNPDDPTGSGAPPRSLVVTTAPPISVTVSLPPPSSLPLTQNITSSANASATLSSSSASTSMTASESATSSEPSKLARRRARLISPNGASCIAPSFMFSLVATLLALIQSL